MWTTVKTSWKTALFYAVTSVALLFLVFALIYFGQRAGGVSQDQIQGRIDHNTQVILGELRDAVGRFEQGFEAQNVMLCEIAFGVDARPWPAKVCGPLSDWQKAGQPGAPGRPSVGPQPSPVPVPHPSPSQAPGPSQAPVSPKPPVPSPSPSCTIQVDGVVCL